jgi:hypothetical protein
VLAYLEHDDTILVTLGTRESWAIRARTERPPACSTQNPGTPPVGLPVEVIRGCTRPERGLANARARCAAFAGVADVLAGGPIRGGLQAHPRCRSAWRSRHRRVCPPSLLDGTRRSSNSPSGGRHGCIGKSAPVRDREADDPGLRNRVEACAGDSRAEIANPVAHAAPALTESTRPDLSDPHAFLACAPAHIQACGD